MPQPGEVTLPWLGGEHVFRLASYGQLRLLQESCDAGPQEVLQRLMGGRWRVDDVREVLRIGLIGGGMAPEKAIALLKVTVDESANWIEFAALAKSIVLAGLLAGSKAAEDDPVGKPGAGKAATEAGLETAASSSPPSTEPALPSDSLRARSTSSRPGNSPPASTAGTPATAASRT